MNRIQLPSLDNSQIDYLHIQQDKIEKERNLLQVQRKKKIDQYLQKLHQQKHNYRTSNQNYSQLLKQHADKRKSMIIDMMDVTKKLKNAKNNVTAFLNQGEAYLDDKQTFIREKLVDENGGLSGSRY